MNCYLNNHEISLINRLIWPLNTEPRCVPESHNPVAELVLGALHILASLLIAPPISLRARSI